MPVEREISDWIMDFRKKRDCQQGDPLFKYKTTREEYEQIVRLLQNYAGERSISLVQAVRRSRNFCGLFVLFASEWWKRKYNGGAWKFETIMNEIGYTNSDWSPSVRSKCIENGLEFWGLDIMLRGRRYIGAIVYNGGIPLKLIEEQSGSVYRLLNRLITEAEGATVGKEIIKNWIEKYYKHYLVAAYRRPEIYDLLASTIDICLKLKEQHNLRNANLAVATLNQREPNWKAKFPISMDDANAIGLVEKLIADTARVVRADAERPIFSIKRCLEPPSTSGEGFRLTTHVEISKQVSREQLKKEFGYNEQKDPLVLSFSFESPRLKKKSQVSLRLKLGRGYFEPDRAVISFYGPDCLDNLDVILRNVNGKTWEYQKKSRINIDADLPWVFTNSGDDLLLAFCGSGNLRDESALVMMNETALSFDESVGFQVHKANVDELEEFSIWRIDDDVILQGKDATGTESYKISLKSRSDSLHLNWVGQKVQEWSQGRFPVFRGLPRLFEGDQDLTGQLHFFDGFKHRIYSRDETSGLVTAKLIQEGFIRSRSSFIVLPADSQESVELGDDKKTCTWKFLKWPIDSSTFHCLDEHFQTVVKQIGTCTYIELAYQGSEIPSNQVRVSFKFDNSPQNVELMLPFYSSQVAVVNSDGEKLESGAFLSLDQIYGTRIVGLNNLVTRISLKLEPNLFGDGEELVQSDLNKNHFELRLIDYKPKIIENLKRLKSENEKEVTLSIRVGERVAHRLVFPLFNANLDRDLETLSFQLEPYHGMNHKADQVVRLQFTPMDLSDDSIEVDVPLGNSITYPNSIDSEIPVVVHSSSESLVQFDHGLLIKNTSEFDGAHAAESITLLSANSISDSSIRKERVSSILTEMAQGFDHMGWGDLEDLIEAFGHLTWHRFEGIKQFMRNPGLLAMGLLRGGKIQQFIIDEVNNDNRLLLFIRRDDWNNAIKKWSDSMLGTLTNDVEKVVYLSQLFQEIIQIEQIEILSGIGPFLDHIVTNNPAFFTSVLDQMRKASLERFNAIQFSDLFNLDANSPYQQMSRRNDNRSFPTSDHYRGLVGSINESMLLEELNALPNVSWRSLVVKLPIAMANLSVGRVQKPGMKQWKNEIMEVRRFDPEWYETAYAATLNSLIEGKI